MFFIKRETPGGSAPCSTAPAVPRAPPQSTDLSTQQAASSPPPSLISLGCLESGLYSQPTLIRLLHGLFWEPEYCAWSTVHKMLSFPLVKGLRAASFIDRSPRA